MKRFLSVLLLFPLLMGVCAFSVKAQDYRDLPPRLLVWQDTLFGLIDGSGKTVLPCEYEGLFTYNDKAYPEGYIVAKRQGLWGVLDWNGRPILPYRYDAQPIPISNSNGFFVVCGNDKPGGVVNSKGDTVVPFHYPNLSEFGISYLTNTSTSSLLSYSVVKTSDSDETTSNRPKRKQTLSGLLDLNGREVLAPVYKELFCTNNRVIVTDTNGYEGLMDFKGKWIRPISPLYTYDYFFYISITERRTRLQGLISDEGNIVLPIEYQEVWPMYPREGLIQAKDRSGLWGIMDEQFRLLIPHRYTELNGLGELDYYYYYYYYGVLQDGRVEIIDKAGRVVPMDKAIRFDKDNLPYSYPLVYVDSVWRLVDPTGKLLPQRYSDASNYWSSTLMSVATDSLHHGIVDLWGNVVVPLRYVEADADGDDLIFARCPSGKVEVFNGKGRKLLSCWGVSQELGVLLVANKQGMWAIADSRTGKRLSQYYYRWAYVSSSSAETCWAVYDTNNRIGYVNARGREIFPCSLDEERAFAVWPEMFYNFIYPECCSCGELIYSFILPNGRTNKPKRGC